KMQKKVFERSPNSDKMEEITLSLGEMVEITLNSITPSDEFNECANNALIGDIPNANKIRI
ncbi:2238_t:CDS:1, partial [Gigaspora margarita]